MQKQPPFAQASRPLLTRHSPDMIIRLRYIIAGIQESSPQNPPTQQMQNILQAMQRCTGTKNENGSPILHYNIDNLNIIVKSYR